MSSDFQLAPSLVSAPLLELTTVLGELKSAGVDVLHIDIEDGHFVPVMNLGVRIIEVLKAQGFFLDVHLMVDDLELIIPQVIRSGADSVTLHFEASAYPRRHLGMIRQSGVQAGLALNPKTPLPDLDYMADLLDCVNILTTEPEDPDCPFIPAMLDKIEEARAWANGIPQQVAIAADGGIDAGNIASVLTAGANRLVVGRSVFANGDIGSNVAALRKAGQ